MRCALSDAACGGTLPRLRLLGVRDLFARPRELGFKPTPLLVGTLRARIVGLVALFALARLPHAADEFLDGAPRRFDLAVHALDLGAARRHLRAEFGKPQLVLPERIANRVALRVRRLCTDLFAPQLCIEARKTRVHLGQLLAELRGLRAARENRTFAFEAAARDRDAACDHLARKRHDRLAQPALPDETHPGVQRVDDEHVTDEEFHDRHVLGCRANEARRVAEHAGIARHVARRRAPLALRQRVERHERRASRLAAVQVLDCALGVGRGARDDVGKANAERRVHRARIPLVDRDEIRDDAFDAAQFAALPRFDDRARSGHVSLECVLQLFDRVQTRFRGRHLACVLAVHALRA